MWGKARADIAPDEVAMATLLAEVGELLLWNFAPELPEAALDVLHSGRAGRSAQAQELACGFRFRELSLKCAELWHLPQLLVQLIRGTDNIRANLCKLYLDTARHLAAGPEDPALPDDLILAQKLIPHAGAEWLAAHMIGLTEEQQAALVEAVRQHLLNQQARSAS
jgi:HD-like signal output (HDOD) protein